LAGESYKKYLFRSNKKNKKNDLKKDAHRVAGEEAK